MSFVDFLFKNNISISTPLPLVHSTPAYHLKSLQQENLIRVAPCDSFKGESLNYFFVGRPAYKFKSDDIENEYWEFPCCFIFDFGSIADIQRIHPFDTGAFKKRLYPSYINMMDIDHFNAGVSSETVGRIIGSYFGSAGDYFVLKPKGEKEFEKEFSLSAMDMEVKALHRLCREGSAKSFDDRRFTIEIQSNCNVDLKVSKPLAVVVPNQYLDHKEFRDHVENQWNAQIIGYPVYALSVTNCYAQIYERVYDFYRFKGLL